MNILTRIAVILGLFMAISVGAYWFGHDRGLREGLALKPETLSPTREIGRLRDEVARLANQRVASEPTSRVSDIPRTNTPGHTNPLEGLRALAEVKAKNMGAYVMLPLIDDYSGKLEAGFAELFNLTPAETATLQQAIDQARQQSEQLMVANATASRRADGAVVISVAPAGSGDSIRAGLFDVFTQTLGPERNEIFLTLQGDQLSSALGGFGAVTRTITFSRTPPSGANGPAIDMKDEQFKPTGGESTGREFMIEGDPSETPALTADSIPGNLHWALSFVPPDF